MPRDYGRAYHALATTLRDSSYLRPVPHADDSDDPRLDTPTGTGTFLTRDSPDLDPALHWRQHTFFDSPLRSNQKPPPTPPSLSRFHPTSTTNAPPKQSHPCTPPNNGGLPTPEVTPPARRTHLAAPPADAAPHDETSSATLAESFATAREDPWASSAGGSHLDSLSSTHNESDVRLRTGPSSKGDWTGDDAPHSRIQSSEVRFSNATAFSTSTSDTMSPDEPPSNDTFLASTSSVSSLPHPSMDSSKSNTVRALIIDRTPRSAERPLRHTHKAVDLRRACSGPSSPTDAGNAARKTRPKEPHVLKRMNDHLPMRPLDNKADPPPPPKELEHLTPDSSAWPKSPGKSKAHTPRKSTDISVRSLGLSTLGPTPLSQRSEFSGPLELEEATAVHLFSHHNDSVTVVQHTPSALPSMAVPPLDMDAASKRERSSLPCGPAVAAAEASPLMNPRHAPMPPLVYVSPPSQDSSIFLLDDRDPGEIPAEPQAGPSSWNSRRPSFLNRARAASAEMIGSATGSLRRSRWGSMRRHPETVPDRPSSATSVPDPFRHPTRFWPDQEYHDHVGGANDRYPGVAEDSELPTESAVKDFALGRGQEEAIGMAKWKRGTSFKGFLIGNTLGLTRGPTNRRRPQIILPSMMPGHRGRGAGRDGEGGRRRRSASASDMDEARARPPGMHERHDTKGWWTHLKASLRG